MAPEPLPVPVSTLVLPERQLQSMVLLPDGDTCVVSAENDGAVHVASLSGQRVLRCLEEHTGPVNSLALAADGRLLLTASDDETIRLWDTASWQVTAVLTGHTGYIREVAACGMTAVSGGEDGTFRVWDLDDAVCRGVFDDHGLSVDHVAIAPDGRRAASASRANQVLLWDLSGPKLERALYDTGQTVLDIPGMSLYMLAGDNRTGVGHGSAPKALVFDATRDFLYTAADEVICWDLADGVERTRHPRRRFVNALALNPELPVMATVSMQGIHFAGLDDEYAFFLPAPESSGSGATVAFLPDGRPVSGHDAGFEAEHCTILVWPALTGNEHRGDHHSTRIDELAVDSAGRRAASTDGNGAVFLWDLSDGSRVAAPTTADDIPCAPFFTPDGSRLVVVDRDRLHLVPTDGGEVLRVPAAEPDPKPDADGHADIEAPLRLSGAAPVDDDTVLVVPAHGVPEVWNLGDGTRRPLRGAAGRGGRGTPVVTARHAVVLATLEKDHPLLPPKFGATTPFGIPALQCWDLVSGALAWTRHGPPTDNSTWPCHSWVVLLRDGTAATISGYGKETSLLVLDIPTGDVRRDLPMPDGYCTPPTELPDGTLVFVYHDKDAVHVRELPPNTEHIVHRLSLPSARTVRLAPDRDLLFRLDATGLHAHRLSTGAALATAELPDNRGELATSPHGNAAVVGDRDGEVHIFHLT
ncbi:hypothetical protein LO772_26845 [Yinghuangia sp. ASG 101]|uniref:WD40 repeat domain-containing protein n=1 Tax=Yinghuangia sp. ASG 101 TaxID=2896848 RepID=UPI001E621EC4|nr:hypothetical protein [Yinghuangia sp. ASG 101]UGQ10440.1 hypothetical protein LO772_26845 [Yinghuangia sp. ASG 101]